MRVSTIVPTRNRPGSLRAALESIVAQSHRDGEILVVDDGSAADNARANEALALEQGATYLFLPGQNARGSGPSCARNAGLGVATGDLVAFCDDDDYWCDTRHLAMAVREYAADPALDVYFANQEAHKDGRLDREVWLPRLESRLALTRQSPDCGVKVSKRDCLIVGFPSMNVCVFRRELLVRIGGFWEEARYLEDMDLYVRAVDAARGVRYRPRTVAVHIVPDRTLKANASAQLDDRNKELARVGVANHLLLHCRSAEARGYARRLAGYAYRELARDAKGSGQDSLAFLYARLGWMWQPTLRWSAYTAFLGVKSLLSSSSREVQR